MSAFPTAIDENIILLNETLDKEYRYNYSILRDFEDEAFFADLNNHIDNNLCIKEERSQR